MRRKGVKGQREEEKPDEEMEPRAWMFTSPPDPPGSCCCCTHGNPFHLNDSSQQALPFTF